MKVDIFTMAYNAQDTIERAVNSILSQKYTNFKYYILDNGSTDETWNIILKYSKQDSRIVPLNINKNDPTSGWAIFRTLVNSTSAKYIVWCDADDEYTSDFLEEMVDFSEKNQLDIAASGYDKINAYTEEVEKHRALDKNLIIYDNLFTQEFIQYRGFISYLWGKLYSTSFLRSHDYPRPNGEARTCNDTIWTLNMFEKASRIGIYGKSMYKYYQYCNSFSHQNIEQSLKSYQDLWTATKKYLESYGPISKINEDFLYAIYLSLVDEISKNIFGADLPIEKKLELLNDVFSNPLWNETLTRDADSQFHNLAQRNSYVFDMKNRISALPDIEQYDNIKLKLFSYLEVK